jgi:hypothetical protein
MKNRAKINKSTILKYLFVILLCSCTNNTFQKEEYIPKLPIPIEKMNQSFTISNLPVFQNSLLNNDLLALDAQNNISSNIIFPGDFNALIYYKENNNWLLAENNIGSNQNDWILPTRKELPGGLLIGLIPNIPNIKEPTLIKVVITGKIEQTNEIVGAYLDLIIKP